MGERDDDQALRAKLDALKAALERRRAEKRVAEAGGPSESERAAQASAISRGYAAAGEFAGAIVAGGLLGWLIDRVLGTKPAFLIVFFLLGVVAGTALGAVAGYWSLARRILDPTLQALRAIPSIAWVPLFILWLGIFETSKITLIAVGVFFPIYLGVMGAILSVDRKIVEVGRTFRLSGPAMIRRILLPAVLPAYVTALRVGLGLGWMFVVAAEFMGASEGLGYLLIDGQQLGKPAQILAAIVIFAVLGKTTDWLIEIGSAPLLRWQDAFGRQGGGA